MKKASVVLVGLLMTVLSFQPAWAQKEKYHSIFIYNFSKYVKWPDAQSSGKFVSGVVGNSAIEKELGEMASTKQVNGQAIEVKHYNSVAEIGACHILYISASESGKIDEIAAKTKNQKRIRAVRTGYAANIYAQ